MIEDQETPKRCGHTRGKSVVARAQAVARVRAAVDAREEGAGILILARTDALATDGLEEALWRARAFSDVGADMLFVEAPTSREQMETIITRAPGHHLANMLEDGKTPLLTDGELASMGFKLVAHPFAVLGASISAMKKALAELKRGGTSADRISFKELREEVGFDDYYREEARYISDRNE